uniref:Ig-like domain-containing protein n=1 Tax=Sinocyclocheilus grahami TaxID=75366 RepID=A0A672T191_SINGR
MNPWTFFTVLCILRIAYPHVHQPDKVITVALGNTVTLQCCSDKDNIYWYKQIAGQPPRVMSAFQKMSEPIFYKEFKNDRFWGKRLGSSSNLTISGIIQSDEAVYYCGAKAFYIEFGSGTHLIIKECQQKCFEKSTNQVKNGKQALLSFNYFCDRKVFIINLETFNLHTFQKKGSVQQCLGWHVLWDFVEF